MEARQSSPLCAHIGLLLLIGLICSPLPEVQGKPADFWCNIQDRINMQTMTENLRENMTECILPSPIQLPCVWVRAAEWKNKTVQQKSAEVMGALWLFLDGVQRARNQTSSSSACPTLVLGMLEHRIRNYIAIVNFVYDQNGAPQSAVDHCSSETSLGRVLDRFFLLVRGKLEHLASNLSGRMCNSDHRTSDSNGS